MRFLLRLVKHWEKAAALLIRWKRVRCAGHHFLSPLFIVGSSGLAERRGRAIFDAKPTISADILI